MKVNENEWTREDKVEIAEGWNTTRYRNTYDPLGEVFFFAAGPFFKPPAFFAHWGWRTTVTPLARATPPGRVKRSYEKLT